VTDGNLARATGRPPVGRPVKYAIPASLRAELEAAKRPRESEAATVRRLLGVALHPMLPAALKRAAETSRDAATAEAFRAIARDIGDDDDGQDEAAAV
jgi:hypothetical protein